MVIREVEFIGSFVKESACPAHRLPEYAFIGRSNVGKSSLINYLLDRKEVAKVSKQPGKTSTINYFRINQSWCLVDLPGYGYAKTSQKNRESWDKMTRSYLAQRKNLVTVFILIDSNISPQQADIDFISWMGNEALPCTIIFCKIDKSKPLQIKHNVLNFQNKLLELWETLPSMFEVSSVKRVGGNAILDYIARLNSALSDQR